MKKLVKKINVLLFTGILFTTLGKNVNNTALFFTPTENSADSSVSSIVPFIAGDNETNHTEY